MGTVDNNHVLYLTGAQAAVFMGISYRHLQQMLMEDDPPPRTDDKKYRTDELGEWVRRRAVKMAMGGKKRGPKPLGPDSADLDETEFLNPVQERARKDKELADKTALENAVKRGELVPAAEVGRKWFEVLTRVRSRLSRIPFAAAPLLFGVEDQVKIQIVLEDQIRDALTELSAD